MRQTSRARDAKALSLFTGMPLELANEAVRSREGELLIPEANADQRLLEQWVVRRICWPSNSPIHPWGIKYVYPRPNGLTIAFEGDNMASELASALVPRYDPTTGDIYGVPGCRITEAGRHGLVLHLLDTDATIHITGIHRRVWRSGLAETDQEMCRTGLRLCSHEQPHEWTAAELAYTGHPGHRATHRSADGSTAWLASGLLRRIGLLRTMGIPLYTTAWTNPADVGEQWILETQYQPLAARASSHHETLLHLLNDEVWGLRIDWTDSHCSCETEYSNQCTFNGRPQLEQAGELQLRFPRRVAERSAQLLANPQAYDAHRRIAVRVPARFSPRARVSSPRWRTPEPTPRGLSRGKAFRTIANAPNQATTADRALL